MQKSEKGGAGAALPVLAPRLMHQDAKFFVFFIFL